MKKTTLLFTVLLIVVLYIWYTYATKTQDTIPTSNVQVISQNDRASIPSVPAKSKYRDDRDSKVQNRQTSKSYSIFEEVDIDEVMSKVAPIENVQPIAALRMKKNMIKNINVGDTLVLPSVDGNAYALTITYKDVSPRGNVSIDGGFFENGIEYSAILTEGASSAFISMNTPEGTYEVELTNGIGYIYTNNDIVKAKVDPSKSDEIMHH